VLNDISTRHAVGLYWVSGHAQVRGNEITNELARDGSALKFDGPELALGVSRQDIRRIRRWLVSQHWVWWCRLGNTQRQARELISGRFLVAKARFLSFIRIQSRAVTGLLTEHNTLRRLHLMGLSNSALFRRCAAENETCDCKALASVRQVCLGTFFLEPEDIMSLRLGAI